MRARFWALIAAMLVLGALAIGLGGCTTPRVARGPANTPVPTKTLRPTFTPTVPKPTLTPSPGAGQSNEQPADLANKPTEAPTATAVPPTATPSPTQEPAAFTVNSASVNVRSGPGTTYPVLGRLTQGQSFPIQAKSDDGDWWQFDYQGKSGWVISSNVAAKGTESLQVAENIPAPPTAAPRPTARPAAPKPAQPPAAPAPAPAPATKYMSVGTQVMPNTNDFLTVHCILFNQAANGLLPGKLRISRDGQVVGTADFNAEATYYLSYGYNGGCKVEVAPAVNGNYTAVIVEGDQVVSEPINFTVNGPADRIQFVKWKAR